VLTKAQKVDLVNDLTKVIKEAPIVVFTDFSGVPVSDSNEMRLEMFKKFEGGARYQVVRNSLIKTAVKKAELNIEDFESYLEGSTGLFFVTEGDAIEGLKLLTDFAKKHKDLPVIKGGLLEGKIFTAEEAVELSKLPSKEQLIAMVLGGLNAPISGFVNVLGGTLKSLLFALNAIKEKK